MISFKDYFNLLQESLGETLELTSHTKLGNLSGKEYLKVYRSSAKPSKNDYTSGSHAGTKQQALIRADYMINDEGRYDTYYLYELVVRIGKVYPKLLPDDGSDHGYAYIDRLGSYDLAFYKNTGEGDIRNENLSIIIINPKTVVSSRMIQTLGGDYLLGIQDELYG